MKRVLPQEALTTLLVDFEEPRDHRRRLRPRGGLLDDCAAGISTNRDIGQALMFNPPRIAPAHIDARRSAQITSSL